MIDIAISGYYGFGNAGDEAMLAAMIEVLTELNPNVRITVISGNAADTRKRHGVRAVDRVNLPAIIATLARSNLLISGGGSLLQDVTSGRSLYYYLGVIYLAKRLGTKVMLYAQGIGPVNGAFAQSVMRHVGNQVDLISVRDEGSREELKRLRISKPQVTVTADPVLAMHPVDTELGRAILRQHQVAGATPLIGISVRDWQGRENYQQALVDAARQLQQELKARIILLPMQWPDDRAASQRLAERIGGNAVVLEGDYTTSELMSIVGNMDLLIGIRLHALIFAAVMQVPLIGISYDPKIERFLATVGDQPVGSLETVTAENLVRQARSLLTVDGKEKERAKLLNGLRKKALLSAELALELADRRR